MRVLIVMGARVLPDGTPSLTLQRRVACALTQWRAMPEGGLEGLIIVTGGTVDGPVSEAAVMAELLENAGVPAAQILREPQARNTLENALYCRALLSDLPYQDVHVITDGSHRLRSWMSFARLGIRVRTLSASQSAPRPRLLVSAKNWAREVLAVPLYAVKLARLRR